MISRAGSWGTVQELRISEPNKKFEGTPLVGIYPVPTRYSYWLGDTKQNSTSMNYTLSASYYQKTKWLPIWTDAQTVTVPANNTAKVNVTLVAPSNSQTGVYQGFLTFEGGNHTVHAPVSYVIKKEVDQKDPSVLISGKQSDDILFGNGYIKGAFDMVNRYMSGDWRQYYFEIKDEAIDSAALELSWETDDTNLAVFVMDPTGKIIQTNMPSGVFGHFLDWPSLDWLGNSLFSQGGGFFPVKNKDKTSTVLLVPINQTGTYSLLAHSTLFGGNQTTEPITITAKFSTLFSDELNKTKPSQETPIFSDELNKTKPSMPVLSYSNDTSPSANIPENVSRSIPDQQIQTLQAPPNNFAFGVILGIVIGTAIGIVFVFVIRQKTSN
jgi:hypothetical protein